MELTALGHCDRCSARAYVRVELCSGLDLVFCGHHYQVNREMLDEVALRVENRMQQLIDSCP